MKVLVVGSGGREHAICRAVAKSSRVDKIYCAPGNAGIAALAECVPIGAMEFDKLVSFAKDNACLLYTSMHQILNMYSMAIEIMRGISGTMGIILTVPITSLIMSFLLTRKNKE